MLNLAKKLFISEEVWQGDNKSKACLLSSINFVLMSFFLLVLIIQFFDEVFFAHPVNQQNFFSLFFLILMLSSTTFLIKKGFIQVAIFLTIGLILLFSFKSSLTLGINTYGINILYSFIILISVVLVNFKFSFFIFLFICLGLSLIYFIQNGHSFTGNLLWEKFSFNFTNLLIILTAFSLILFLAWFFSKEIEKFYKKNKKLKHKLKLQNDHLEIIVKNRTKKLEASQLQQLIKIAPLLDLGKLSVGLVHDIRESLTILSIILQNAQEDRNVVTNLDKAFLAIDRIDDLSKMTVCKIFDDAEIDVFNLNQEIEKLVSLFDYRAKLKKIRIIFKPNTEFELCADRSKLNQILSNLILNALESYDHSDQSDRCVFIKLVKKPRNLLIIVKDYGVGISEENLPRIFEPKFSSKDERQSLGLGLYVSQEAISKIYESKIKVESQINHGSTFTVLIKNKFIVNALPKQSGQQNNFKNFPA
jgi:signal transduction histidine kinase